MARRDLTRAFEILAGKRETNPLSHGVGVRRETARDTKPPDLPEAASGLDSAVSPSHETPWDKVPVSLSHTPLGVRHETPETAERDSADRDGAFERCTRCAHVTRYGNCGEPVAAGLLERFGLVRHPEDGRGCPAFTRQPTDLDERAVRLLAAGAIEPADLGLLCERQNAHPADEWGQLLDWCEAVACDGAAVGETGLPARSLAATKSDRSY